jgi:hypothetical protein
MYSYRAALRWQEGDRFMAPFAAGRLFFALTPTGSGEMLLPVEFSQMPIHLVIPELVAAAPGQPPLPMLKAEPTP